MESLVFKNCGLLLGKQLNGSGNRGDALCSARAENAYCALQARIVQRGAVPPLITMLGQTDVQLKEMGAFALGRLAQNADNQAGIVQVRSAAGVITALQIVYAGYLPSSDAAVLLHHMHPGVIACLISFCCAVKVVRARAQSRLP